MGPIPLPFTQPPNPFVSPSSPHNCKHSPPQWALKELTPPNPKSKWAAYFHSFPGPIFVLRRINHTAPRRRSALVRRRRWRRRPWRARRWRRSGQWCSGCNRRRRGQAGRRRASGWWPWARPSRRRLSGRCTTPAIAASARTTCKSLLRRRPRCGDYSKSIVLGCGWCWFSLEVWIFDGFDVEMLDLAAAGGCRVAFHWEFAEQQSESASL